MDYIWINLLSKNERKEMEKKKTSESEEGIRFIYVVMIVIAEAEKGKSRKKAHLNFQEPVANCITGTQKVSHGKKILFFKCIYLAVKSWFLLMGAPLLHMGSLLLHMGSFLVARGLSSCGARAQLLLITSDLSSTTRNRILHCKADS